MKPQLTFAVAASVVLALATSLWTWLPHKTETAKEAERTGQLLTLDGKKIVPEDITSLRVASWDTESKDSKMFEVSRKDNVWVIPTKYDYPADGGSRVGKTAGGVLNVPRGPLVTSDAKHFADLGVVDPLKEGTADPEGRGKRVTLKDSSGAVVVDLIVGKKAEKTGVSYVREANSNDVYTAKVDVDISTSFKDWVETDLLKIVSGDIRMIGIRDYSIDMDTQEFKERASTTFTRPKDKNEWSCDKTPAEKVVNQDTIGKLLSEATAMRLADVHPFVDNMLDECGILRSREGAVFGKEGMLVLGVKDGLRYHLIFGTIAVTGESKDPGKDKPKEGAGEAGKPKNRYMAVLPVYDPAFDEDKAAKSAEKSGDKAESKTGEPAGAKDKDDKEKETAGQKRAAKAQKRFFKFIYIIGDETFKKLRPDAETLFKSKDAKESLPGEKVPKELNLEKSSSGLEYVDLKKGDGDEAGEGDEVQVHYTGWLEKDGSKFDSSVDRNEPFPFSIGKGQVIKGWDEGVKGMKVGGKRKLVIPSDLGYGPNGSPPKIPGGATLVFDVELLKIAKKAGGKMELPKPPPPTEKKTETPKKEEEDAKKSEAPKPVEEPKKSEAPAKPEEKKPDESLKTEPPAKPEEKKADEPVKAEVPAKPEEKKTDETLKTEAPAKPEEKKTEEPVKTETPAKLEEKKPEELKKTEAPAEEKSTAPNPVKDVE